MSSDIKPPTWNYPLRATQEEKAIVQRVIDAHQAMGYRMSINDALLVIIRRAAVPDADTEEEARSQIEHHWKTCPHGCHNGRDVSSIRCPEGWRLRDAYSRITHRERRTAPTAGRSPGSPHAGTAPVRALRSERTA